MSHNDLRVQQSHNYDELLNTQTCMEHVNPYMNHKNRKKDFKKIM